MTRILSDYYGKGIVRSTQESTNLRSYSCKGDVTAAECIKTRKNVQIPSVGALRLVERMNACSDQGKGVSNTIGMEYDHRDHNNVKIVSNNGVFLYALRPMDHPGGAELAYLSLYELFSYWRIELGAYVISDGELPDENLDIYHARLTFSGIQKVAERIYNNREPVPFLSGVDYLIKEEEGEAWLPFPNLPELVKIRHTWILVRNERPLIPSFSKAPMPDRKSGQEKT